MTTIELSNILDPAAQRFARLFVSHVLNLSDPGKLVSKSVEFKQFNSSTHVLAFGKASAKMAQACVQELGSRVAGGVVLAPESLIPDTDLDDPLLYLCVDHPAPTPRNVDATNALVQYAQSIPAGHDCIVCISGGGSAHLCSPKPGITLEQIIVTTNSLNAGGANIRDLNKARRSLETLKSGGLAEILTHTHKCQAVVLSDILDDDLNTIASGPMMCSDHPVEHTIIGNHRTALDAAAEFVGGRNVGNWKSGICGNSSDRGRELAEAYLTTNHAPCLIAGETTVDASSTVGIGGPCMELTLSCALELAESGLRDWITLGLATDGIDGPSEAAGAVILSRMLSDPDRQLSARKALVDHNTLPFLESIHATIRTGPTGTNLNDLCLVCPQDAMGAEGKSVR